SYPKSPRCPGPLPGVMPGATGTSRPCDAAGTRASRLGVRAASSGVRPPCADDGRSPTPSSTSSTMRPPVSSASDCSTALMDSADPIALEEEAAMMELVTGDDPRQCAHA